MHKLVNRVGIESRISLDTFGYDTPNVIVSGCIIGY